MSGSSSSSWSDAPGARIGTSTSTRGDYRESHPTRPALAVEVADSSLDFDQRQKGSLYARAGVEDYWIVNLIDRVVEVYRDPGPDPSAPYGWRYRSLETLTPPAVIVPLVVPAMSIAVAALLP